MKIYLFDDIKNAGIDYLVNIIDTMPSQRAQQAHKYINPRDKAICVLSYLLLKYALRDNGINSDILLTYGNNSKPYLKDSSVYFNISHSHDVVICGVSDTECGVDTEKIKPYKNSLLEKVCSAEEISLVRESSDEKAAFARIWTKKESYIKYKALGIATDLKIISSLIKEENLNICTVKYKDYIISSCAAKKETTQIISVNFNALI